MLVINDRFDHLRAAHNKETINRGVDVSISSTFLLASSPKINNKVFYLRERKKDHCHCVHFQAENWLTTDALIFKFINLIGQIIEPY